MSTLQIFTFLVQDESDVRYEVVFLRHSTGHLSAYCSCKPRQPGRYCDHRLRLLEGDTSQLISDNEAEVSVLQWWVTGSDLRQSVARVVEAETSGRRGRASPRDVFAFWPKLDASVFSPATDEPEVEATG